MPTFVSGLAQKNINILDIGGGYGSAFLSTKFSCPTKVINSTVMELPETVARGGALFKDCNGIEFSVTLPEQSYDIVYFGSSLQYFEDYNSFLLKMFSYSNKYIVIADTPMGECATFVCAQVNMTDNVISRFVFSLKEIRGLFESFGYTLVHKSINYYPFHNFDNYHYPQSTAEHWNLIFEK